MKYLTSIFVVVALLGAVSANADQLRRSIDGCKQAITERLSATSEDTRVHLKKVKSKARYTDYKFTVTTSTAQARPSAGHGPMAKSWPSTFRGLTYRSHRPRRNSFPTLTLLSLRESSLPTSHLPTSPDDSLFFCACERGCRNALPNTVGARHARWPGHCR